MGFKNIATLLQDKRVIYKELKLKDYRNLVKSFLGDEIDPETVFVNTDNILQLTTELTSNEINNLNFVDYILLLLHIRSTSIGNHINLYTKDNNNTPIQINLLINNIISVIHKIIKQELFYNKLSDNIKIKYKLPTINEILKDENNIDETFFTCFLQEITIQNTKIILHNYSFTEIKKILDNLPIKIIALIKNHITTIKNLFNEINFLESVQSSNFSKSLPLLINTEVISYIIKIIFNTDLENIYNSIFILSKVANIDSSFLDNCTPGEFFIFVKKIEEINFQTKIKNNNKQSLNPINTPNDFIME